jgi:hypothetical protein
MDVAQAGFTGANDVTAWLAIISDSHALIADKVEHILNFLAVRHVTI